jgi:adenylate cyclase
MSTETRKLAAIMFTDMVGYSSLSHSNEQLALELLEKHRELLRGVFPHFYGNEVKTIGDAFLVEFNSALDAVSCSIEIQKKLKEYNETAEDGKHIYLRIGIHMGDVVHRDNDIYGDGVNISSRIEPLAQPGGICISEDVARQVQNKLSVAMQKMDKQQLKNIKLPIDIYQILLYANPEAVAKKTDGNRLVVLPFQNFSPDNDSDYFSDGLTEELTMHLASVKELKVVSRTTSMQYKNAQKDILSIGKEVNARYVLEGSVRKHEDNLRITAQLIDVKTDTHLWAETYRGNMKDIFDIQENVSKEIVDALRITLSPAEKVALVKRATSNSDAFDLNLRAREFLYRRTKSHLLAAVGLFEQAIELDPKYAAAYAGLAEDYSAIYEWHDKNPKWLDKAMEASMKALMYNPNSSEAYGALGWVYYLKQNIEEAMEAIEKAIKLDDENFFAHWLMGRALRMLERVPEAVDHFKRVLEINPNFHSVYGDLQMTYEQLGDEEKLNDIIQKAIAFYPGYLMRNPDDARAIIFYSCFLQFSGNIDEAKNQMIRAVSLNPNDAIMNYNAACFYSTLNEKEKAVEYLTKAIEIGYHLFDYIKTDPDLKNIRKEPGYLKLFEQK